MIYHYNHFNVLPLIDKNLRDDLTLVRRNRTDCRHLVTTRRMTCKAANLTYHALAGQTHHQRSAVIAFGG